MDARTGEEGAPPVGSLEATTSAAGVRRAPLERVRDLEAKLAGVEPRPRPEQGLRSRFKGWVRLEDSFNQRYNLGCRLREAVHSCEEACDPANSKAAMSDCKRREIVAHLVHAALLFERNSVELETILRELFTAERELIPFISVERGAAAIADVRSEISVTVPEAHRTALFAALDDAAELQKAKPGETAWRDDLFAAKAQADEIVIDSYRSRERMRDGIVLLGVEMAVCILLILVSGLLAEYGTAPAAQVVAGGAAADAVALPGWFAIGLPKAVTVLSGAGALWLGFLFGALGACLSGLYGFTVTRSAPGEYETAAATAIRPLIGGASGIVAAALFGSGLLAITTTPVPMLILICFVFGFSERIVMGTVESLGSRVTRATAPPTASGPVPNASPQR